MVPRLHQTGKSVSHCLICLRRGFSRPAIAENNWPFGKTGICKDAFPEDPESGETDARKTCFSRAAYGKNQAQETQKKSLLPLYEELSCLEIQTETKLSIAELKCLLYKCEKKKSLPLALHAHSILRDMGLEAHASFGNPLVSILAEAGSMQHAQRVFNRLEQKGESSWNSMITGFAKCGELGHAYSLYERMQMDASLHVSSHAMVALLNICGRNRDVERGSKLHADIARRDLLANDVYIGSTLVDMYARCGLLGQAQEVFHVLPMRNIVSWNALLAGYVEHGCEEMALHKFEQMLWEGCSPSAVTFVCVLKACVHSGALDRGQGVHIEITKIGLEIELFIGCILIDMYAKSGLLVEAHKVFDQLTVHDVVSWTALMAGYGEHRFEERALDIFEQMQEDNVSPSAVTLACSLKACGNGRLGFKGQSIHAKVVKKGMEDDPIVGSTLVDMYAKCSALLDAQSVFDKMIKRDMILWTTLLAGYMDNGCFMEVLSRLEQMQQEGVSLEAGVIVCSLKACANTECTLKGRELHAQTVKMGLEGKPPIGNILVDMYSKCSVVEDAQNVFNYLLSRDVVTWTALLAGYAQLGQSDSVFISFDRMISEDTQPNLITFLILLNACSHAGAVERGQIYFKAMVENYGLIPTVEHYACLADLFGRTGLIGEAATLVAEMPFHPSTVVWLTLLAACRKWGSVDYGKHAFEEAAFLDRLNASVFLCMFNIYADAEMQEDVDEVAIRS